MLCKGLQYCHSLLSQALSQVALSSKHYSGHLISVSFRLVAFLFLYICITRAFRTPMHTHSQKERSNKWFPCIGLVGPGNTFQSKRKDSLTVAWGHFRLIFLLYQTAALNYRIFLRSVSLPGPQPVPGITDARLERQAFLSGKKETACPPLVDLFFFLKREQRNC